jgi:hypothetical protein
MMVHKLLCCSIASQATLAYTFLLNKYCYIRCRSSSRDVYMVAAFDGQQPCNVTAALLLVKHVTPAQCSHTHVLLFSTILILIWRPFFGVTKALLSHTWKPGKTTAREEEAMPAPSRGAAGLLLPYERASSLRGFEPVALHHWYACMYV